MQCGLLEANNHIIIIMNGKSYVIYTLKEGWDAWKTPAPIFLMKLKLLAKYWCWKEMFEKGSLSQAPWPLPLKKRVSVLYSWSCLYLNHSHNGTSKPRGPVWEHDLHIEARRRLTKALWLVFFFFFNDNWRLKESSKDVCSFSGKTLNYPIPLPPHSQREFWAILLK